MDVSELVTVVVATRDRRDRLAQTLRRLEALPDRPAVLVVDNASSDGTSAAVRRQHPSVVVVALPANLGASARTVGARLAATPLVAFSDDDSWWDPGALSTAAGYFGDPALGLVTGRVLVEPGGSVDPTSAVQAAGAYNEQLEVTPVGRRGVTGFLACAAVVRRAAFLAAGGFEARLLIGGEEELVALDLAGAGWKLVYAPDMGVRHHPSPGARPGRTRLLARNHVLTAGLRYPPATVVRRMLRPPGPLRLRATVTALADAAPAATWTWAHRRRATDRVAAAFAARDGGPAGRRQET